MTSKQKLAHQVRSMISQLGGSEAHRQHLLRHWMLLLDFLNAKNGLPDCVTQIRANSLARLLEDRQRRASVAHLRNTLSAVSILLARAGVDVSSEFASLIDRMPRRQPRKPKMK